MTRIYNEHFPPVSGSLNYGHLSMLLRSVPALIPCREHGADRGRKTQRLDISL